MTTAYDQCHYAADLRTADEWRSREEMEQLSKNIWNGRGVAFTEIREPDVGHWICVEQPDGSLVTYGCLLNA